MDVRCIDCLNFWVFLVDLYIYDVRYFIEFKCRIEEELFILNKYFFLKIVCLFKC